MKKIAGAVFSLILLTGCSYREVIHKKDASLPETLCIGVVYDGKTKVNGLWFDDPPVKTLHTGDATGDMNISAVVSATSEKKTPEMHSQTNGQDTKKEGGQPPPPQENGKGDEKKTAQQTENKTAETAGATKYLTDKSKRDYYKKIFEKIQVNIEKILAEYLKKNGLTTQLFHYTPGENIGNRLLVEIKIKEYIEGEFNLITNKDTEMTYDVNVFDENKKVIANFRKKYIVKTNLEVPLEYVRLSKIDDQFSADLADFLAKVFIAPSAGKDEGAAVETK